MSEILIKTKNSTKIKPDSWYKEFLEIENNYLMKHSEKQSKMPLTTIEEIKEIDTLADKNKSNYISGFLQFDERNNLKANKEILKQCIKDLKSLKLWKSIEKVNNLDDIDEDNEKYCILQTYFKIKSCYKALKQGYLITAQLEDIYMNLDDFYANEIDAKPILDLLRQFKFKNYKEDLFEFIKQNTNWRNKERDFKIYQEIQKGTLYSEIAEELECHISNISKINKKIQSSINNLKGKFFEIEFEKYLMSLDKFRNGKIVRDGTPGKPDIYINDEIKNELYVFSLKNLELNKNPYTIIKEKLKPELGFAYLKSTFEEYNKVVLYLVVYDCLIEKLYVNELDFRNPSNVNIYH